MWEAVDRMSRARIFVPIGGPEAYDRVWSSEFVAELSQRGDVSLDLDAGSWSADRLATRVRNHDIAIVGWDTAALPAQLADDRGALELVACYSGSVRPYVPRALVEAAITVTNWGDLPAGPVAEAALTHLLVALHQIPEAVTTTRDGGWGLDVALNGTLDGLAVGIVGMGVIGRRFVDALRPFGSDLTAFDPHVSDLPDGVTRAETVTELCAGAEALVIHAALNTETAGLIGAEELSLLPDHAIVVNTARGAILDQDALFAEVLSGRLRVGVDVLEPDWLDPDHPVRNAANFCVTFHQLDQIHWPQRAGLTPIQERVLAHVDRHLAGAAPVGAFDLDRYDRST